MPGEARTMTAGHLYSFSLKLNKLGGMRKKAAHSPDISSGTGFTPGNGGPLMIELSRLNQKSLIVNSDLIKFVENTQDTVITLVSEEKFVVLEGAETIVERVVEFRRRLLDGAPSSSNAFSSTQHDWRRRVMRSTIPFSRITP
jgi:flagellar protein FlbD